MKSRFLVTLADVAQGAWVFSANSEVVSLQCCTPEGSGAPRLPAFQLRNGGFRGLWFLTWIAF